MRLILYSIGLLLFVSIATNVAHANFSIPVSAHTFLSSRPITPSSGMQTIAYSVDSLALSHTFAAHGHIQLADFPGSYNDRVTLDLKPAHSPVDASTEVWVGGNDGSTRIQSPSFLAYRGTVLGEPHSRVMLTVFAGRLLCSILRESGETYVLGPAKNETDPRAHVFVKETDLLSSGPFTPFNCINEDVASFAPHESPSVQYSPEQALSTSTLLQTDIAVEADSSFYHAAGGTNALVLGYIASLFAMSSAIYEDEANITWHLTWIKMWPSGDPYNVKGNAYAMDSVVRPYWRSHYMNVPRDLAHILTSSPNGGGGYGWYSLCDTVYSYSYSSPQTGHTYPTFAFTYDAYIVAHEVGHNFSLQHTHSCWWAPPLDTCYTKDDTKYGLKLADACCSLPITPRQNPGSIMSYCPGANYAITGDFNQYKVGMTFTKRGDDSLRKFAQLAPCIQPPENPIVILTSPRGSMTYLGDTTIAIQWSYAHLQNVGLAYSSNGGSNWTPINPSVSASAGSYAWRMPNAASQKMLVRVFDAASDTVADTSLLFFSVTHNAGVADGNPPNGKHPDLSFTLVPDPAGETVSLIPSQDVPALNWEILDTRGGVMTTGSGKAVLNGGLAINLQPFSAGTYFLHITSPVQRVIAFAHHP